MDGSVSTGQRVSFKSPRRFLADLDPETAARVVESAADVALILEEGVIQDVALGNEELTREGYDRDWPGRRWVETVTVESRSKIEDLLEADPHHDGRWRQVNHPSTAGLDVPIRYTAVHMGDGDRIVALGRDLRSASLLQQRLVEAHQNLERDYSRLREAEGRYRLLFQSVSQPLLIVDAETGEVEEANPAAGRALGEHVASLQGSAFQDLFSQPCRRAAAQALGDAIAGGQADASGLRTRNGTDCDLAASAYRREESTRVIVRLEGGPAGSSPRGELLRVLEELPDGFVVAGADLRILAVNRAFIDMASLVNRGQAVGSGLSDLLGRSPTDLNVLISSLKTHGAVRNFTTALRDRLGGSEEVEVSAVAATLDDTPCYGFSVRSVARRIRTDPRVGEKLPSSAEQLTELVGRVPLREIVRESTDLIERLCIEAALDITDDNRASAAEMLGLSRQGLYSKLRRFGFDTPR